MLRPWQRTIRRRWEPRGATNLRKLERWLGADAVAHAAACFSRWPGPPVAVGGVPGNVYITGGGNFIGPIDVGDELTHLDMAEALVRRERMRRFASHSRQTGAFASLSALIAARTGGKGIDCQFRKASVASSAALGSMDLWITGTQPSAGAAGAATPGGTATTNATAGNWGYVNAVANANTGHFLGGWVQANFVNALLIIDQLFRVAKTASSSATEAVTGTFSRYQSTTATDANYIGGNFCFPSVTSVIAAVAHNWTVCQYTPQTGSGTSSFGSATGISACVAGQIDIAVAVTSWSMALSAGDVGVKALSQLQCSVNTVTGAVDFVVAHPIGMMPVPIASNVCMVDTLTTAIDQLSNVYDNACISALELPKPATNATTYGGKLSFCSE